MLRRHSLVATAAACALPLAALPAVAAPTAVAVSYSVRAGTRTSGTTSYTAVTGRASPQVAFADADTATPIWCQSATASGSFKLGSGLPGTALGSIASSTWTGCVGPLNLRLTLTQTAPWSIDATSRTTDGVTAGTVNGIAARFSAIQGGCSFTVSGSLGFTITATTAQQLLTFRPTSTLAIGDVLGCFAWVKNGDRASLKTVWRFTAAAGPVAITNP